MIKSLVFLLGVWTALVPLASAAPKWAVVRVSDIYNGLESTKILKASLGAETKAIYEDQRFVAYAAFQQELKALEKQYEESGRNLDAAAREAIIAKGKSKAKEFESLAKECESFQQERELLIKRRLHTASMASITHITKIAAKVAEERGFELVIETSGDSNTGVPFLLYAKGATDLTDAVIAALIDSPPPMPPVSTPAGSGAAPPAPAPVPAPAPGPTPAPAPGGSAP